MGASFNKWATGLAGNDPVREAVVANKRLFGAALSFSAAINILALTVSLYMLQVYDRVLSSRSEETLLLLTLIAFGSLAVLGVLDATRIQLLMRVGMRVGDALGTRVLRAMVETSARNGGATDRQGLRDVDSLRNFIGSQVFASLLDAPFLLLFLVVLFFLHWALFLIVLVGGALLVAITLLNQVLTARPLIQSMGNQVRAHAFADAGLQNSDVLEGMGMSSVFVERWYGRWLASMAASLSASDREASLMAVSKTIRQLIQVALLGTGALLVLDYHATGGVMIASSILGSRALAPIESTVGAWKTILAVRLAWARLASLIGQAPKRHDGMTLPAPRGNLIVDSATYVAPSGQRRILSNVTFELGAGETLGIIGPSASGKTTLVKLLIGAWPCSGGIVRLDGGDIYAWPRQDLGRYIGYLPQDVELFAGTVRENIARLNEGATDGIVRAAELANAHKMILALPKGYDTDIGEQGHLLSGGQRQRIGLARALFGEPRVVALDEPNSNLDSEGEAALMTALLTLKKRGVTIIVVAHRPAVLEHVDKMLVLLDGKMEAFGPRAEIMQRYVPSATVRPAQQAPRPDASDARANVLERLARGQQR